MATYPTAIASFPTNTDDVDIIYAADVNNLQDEMVAVQTELGTDPSGTFATVKDRIAGLETNKSNTTHTHALGDLSNVTATGEGSGGGFDADTVDGQHASSFAALSHGTHVTYGTVVDSIAYGQASSVGVSTEVSRADHSHPTTGFAPSSHGTHVTYGTVVDDIAFGQAAAVGTSTEVSRADHSHSATGFAASSHGTHVDLADNAPTDTASTTGTVGVGAQQAREDHRHGFVTGTPAALSFGGEGLQGVAEALPRLDHAHQMPVHDKALHDALVKGAKVRRTTDVNPGVGYQTIVWESEILDEDNYWIAGATGTPPTGSKLTIPNDGRATRWYLAQAQLLIASISSSNVYPIDIVKNNTTTVARSRRHLNSTTTNTVELLVPLQLAAGDYLTVQFDSGATSVTVKAQYGNGDVASFFSIVSM